MIWIKSGEYLLMPVFSTLILSLFLTIIFVPIFKIIALKINVVDLPEARKVHKQPMAKSGGISMALGALVPVLFWVPPSPFVRSVLIASGIIVVFGVVDDITVLGYKAKLLGQVLAALTVILYGDVSISCMGGCMPDGVNLPAFLAVPVTLLVIVGVTNAINLSDGLDGLAGGVSVLTFICLGYMAWLAENPAVSLMAFAVSGAIMGFLRYNTHPAVVFMGDAGSQLLGFNAVVFSIGLTQQNAPLSPLMPMLLLALPVMDTLTVMVERMAAGRSPFVADKNHFHHKLMRMGLYHSEAVLMIYGLHAVLVSTAFLFRFSSDWFFLFSFVVFAVATGVGVYSADAMGMRLRRIAFLDVSVKGRLKELKDNHVFIRVSYGILKWGIPFLMLLSCFVPKEIPGQLGIVSAFMIVLVVVLWAYEEGLLGLALHFAAYTLFPVLIYMGEAERAAWLSSDLNRMIGVFYGVITLSIILTLRLTRRKKGFQINPMHFLILFIALVVPNLPDAYIQSHRLGFVAAKIIIFYFSYDILVGEMRRKYSGLGISILAALVVVLFRSLG